jgi:hypothetical protein
MKWGINCKFKLFFSQNLPTQNTLLLVKNKLKLTYEQSICFFKKFSGVNRGGGRGREGEGGKGKKV